MKPRAMSAGGRWRRTLQTLRVVALLAFLGGLGWGGWLVTSALREDSPHMPAMAKAVPVRPPELRTTRDGVLDAAWLARTLALPPRVSLMELDLAKLRERVLADGQVLTAALTRQFPDRLIVQVTERTPVARIRIQRAGFAHDLLVARDGVVFAGSGFDRALLETLPWLGGVTLSTDASGFRPIAGMKIVSQLLTDAQFAAKHLYDSWQIVSLARVETDDELEVTTKDNTTVVFTTRTGFFNQLAKLDYMLEQLAHVPRAKMRIDLTFGREVPVKIEPLAAAGGPGASALPPLPAFSRPLSITKREL